jgi:hypothetical protein
MVAVEPAAGMEKPKREVVAVMSAGLQRKSVRRELVILEAIVCSSEAWSLVSPIGRSPMMLTRQNPATPSARVTSIKEKALGEEGLASLPDA